MRMLLAATCLSALLCRASAQPADCPTEPTTGPTLPLSVDLAGRTGVPSGISGQAYVTVPLSPRGMDCRDAPQPPVDVLQGPPADLLRGPGSPHVTVEVK